MTNQEMFDKAWNGLKSQGFERCMSRIKRCVYSDSNGKHCAWGWIDKSLTDEIYCVEDLFQLGVGVAATLSASQLDFVVRLQICHDNAFNAEEMQENLRNLAKEFYLIVPE